MAGLIHKEKPNAPGAELKVWTAQKVHTVAAVAKRFGETAKKASKPKSGSIEDSLQDVHVMPDSA